MRVSPLQAVFVVLVLPSVLFAKGLRAQDPRTDLIAQARNEFDLSAALELLMDASDPNEGLDSIWATGVQNLASTLLSSSDTAGASLFLRWAARHGSRWPIDRVTFPGQVVEAYDAAVAAVGTGGGTDVATTRWQWPEDWAPGASGTIAVSSSDPSVAPSASVEGGGTTNDQGRLSLQPGTYEVVISAAAYETVRVTREVLPGVVTELDVALLPVLTADVESQVANRVVTIGFPGDPNVCTNGVLTERGFVLTTLSGLRETSGLSVTAALGVFQGVDMIRSDPETDLAVLGIDVDQANGLPDARGVSDGQYVWGVFNRGCGPTASGRTQLSGWTPSPAGPVGLAPSLGPDAAGGPVVDRTGALVGLATSSLQMIPAALAEDLLGQAIAEAAAQIPSSRGGLPWKWIGGVGVAGVAAAVLLGGGGGGGSEPTTGEIVITIPGG